MALKDRIKEARKNNHLTQEQLASTLGIAKSTLAGYETGSREPSIDMLGKLMTALNIGADYLLQDGTDVPMQVSYSEMEHIKKYRGLDHHGKEMVDFTLQKEWERSAKIITFETQVLSAANERPDATIEDRLQTDDIMKNDSEWE